MTVSTDTNRVDYTGDGTLDTYPYTFRIFDNADLTVYVDGGLQVLDVNYSVTDAGEVTGGNVVFAAGSIPGLGIDIAIIRILDLTQETDYVELDKFPAETHEDALDKLTMIDQQLKEGLDRSLKFGQSSSFSGITVPELVASQFIQVNAAGTGLQLVSGTPAAPGSTFLDGTEFQGLWYDSSTYASINAAVTAIGGTEATLVVSSAEILTGSITFPATMHLKIVKGGSIVKASSYTVTINGSFEAGLYQVFSGFSSGNVTFAGGSVTEVYPEWWATNTTPGTTDMTDAIQTAVNIGGIPVKLQPNTYAYTTIELKSGSQLIGSGWANLASYAFGNAGWLVMTNHKGTILKCTSDSEDSITFGTTANIFSVRIKDLMILGPGAGSTIGVNAFVGDGSTYYLANNYGFLDNVLIANFETGAKFDYFITGSIYDLIVRGCTNGVIWGGSSPCNDVKIYNLEIQNCGTAYESVYATNVSVFGGIIQNNTVGLEFNPGGAGYVYSMLFDDIWFESNTTPFVLTNGSRGLNHISLRNCRSGDVASWTFAATDVIAFVTIDNCYFDHLTIDFTALIGVGYTKGWAITNSRLADLVGIPMSTPSANFSGRNVYLITPDLWCDLIGPGNKVVYDTAAPAAGTWAVGDRCWDNTPVSGQPMGWVCTVAGTPGTWTAMPNLA